MQSLNTMIEGVADNAKKANGIATETSERAEEGGSAVGKNIEAMKLIDKSSEQIAEIIGVISEIAAQTNLLALNAAIEASRAGEHGRGFAVVADEVKKLAEKTTVATKEIREVIKTIQSQTEEAILKIRSGGDDIDESIEIVTEAGENMVNMVNMVDSVASKIDSISVAAEQQSACSQQITETFQNITKKIQKSSIDVENTSQLFTEVMESMRQAL